ncbi:DNA methyltransferase [Bosea sp. TWI1241]|uniref:DNA methyltransferase n=1 Tax=Bosea sp. TWI1241 TaxID=3148904 RepID=UPI00320B81D1
MHLSWHDYAYFPYERDLALREVAAIVGCQFDPDSGGLMVRGSEPSSEQARRLTYFSALSFGSSRMRTIQSELEQAARSASKRQATRYSAHGLHEYKGKFNPQVARAILNIFGAGPGKKILDPFCGSGTTLVESAHLGAEATGIDINPMAVFLSNAKLLSLTVSETDLKTAATKVRKDFERHRSRDAGFDAGERRRYLEAWFEPSILATIERLRIAITEKAGICAPVLLALASDLLRDYSLQDPADLRIRRRTSPPPSVPFIEAFAAACDRFIDRIAAAQAVLGEMRGAGKAILGDVTTGALNDARAGAFDMAITSPPYAMALPYVDTQRLSLAWLGLIGPERIRPLESELVGSREFGKAGRSRWERRLSENADRLPEAQHRICMRLSKALGPSDGFRRQAVPPLLYRYLVSMRDSFSKVAEAMKQEAPYALIVGHNHTVLSNVRFDIDTPAHLAALAESVGWRIEETTSLQTYRRYGLHASNAVEAETLLVLRKL